MIVQVRVSALSLLLISISCAPLQEVKQSSGEPKTPVESENSSPAASEAPEEIHIRKPEPSTEPSPVSQTGGDEPDWSRRYHELREKYQSAFSPPETGRPIEVQMLSGRQFMGILLDVTETELVLERGNGRVTLTSESLHPASAKSLFAPAYAAYHARKQAIDEYRRWQEQHGPVSDSPDPGNTSSASSAPETRKTEPDQTPWFIPQESDNPMFPVDSRRGK